MKRIRPYSLDGTVVPVRVAPVPGNSSWFLNHHSLGSEIQTKEDTAMHMTTVLNLAVWLWVGFGVLTVAALDHKKKRPKLD